MDSNKILNLLISFFKTFLRSLITLYRAQLEKYRFQSFLLEEAKLFSFYFSK